MRCPWNWCNPCKDFTDHGMVQSSNNAIAYLTLITRSSNEQFDQNGKAFVTSLSVIRVEPQPWQLLLSTLHGFSQSIHSKIWLRSWKGLLCFSARTNPKISNFCGRHSTVSTVEYLSNPVRAHDMYFHSLSLAVYSGTTFVPPTIMSIESTLIERPRSNTELNNDIDT
jgi:hypothetical protein